MGKGIDSIYFLCLKISDGNFLKMEINGTISNTKPVLSHRMSITHKNKSKLLWLFSLLNSYGSQICYQDTHIRLLPKIKF